MNDPLLAEEARRRKTIRSWGVVVAIVFVVAIIFTNIPRATTNADRRVQLRSEVTQINNDLLGCNTAIRDAFDALQAIESNPAKNAKIGATLLSQDQAECTVVNSDILSLVESTPPNAMIKLNISPVINDYYRWAFPNADALIAYVTSFAKDRSSVKLRNDILGRFASMQKNLTIGNDSIEKIAKSIGMNVSPLRYYNLSNVPKGVLTIKK
jgi:hypothetical protein